MLSIILHTILVVALGLIVYSYVGFPLLLRRLAKGKIANTTIFDRKDDLPFVSVLMSLYNEEKVIEPKLETLQQQSYPVDCYNVLIASDCSDDTTDTLVDRFIQTKKISNFHFYPNTIRQGKPGVINQLANEAKRFHSGGGQHIFIITDASVFLEPDVVFELVKHFKNSKIGLVDSMQVHTGMKDLGISKSEDRYISGEANIKLLESRYNGKMMGPFGGCYALRSELYVPVPDNYLVDDFFLAMHVLEEGYDAINERKAVCTESVSHTIQEEYRRKKRISAGNFQNLMHYKHLLSPTRSEVAFSLWSHKVLRWVTPILIIVALVTNVILVCRGNLFTVVLLAAQLLLVFVIPIIDWVLEKGNIHISIFRSIRYFFMMNLALFEGFIKYIKGIKSNVWQPTQRHDPTEYNT